MAPIQKLPPALVLTPRIRRLPNGLYEAFVEYHVSGNAESSPESYIAGSFDSDHQARIAAFRLLLTFRSDVVASDTPA